MSGLLWFASSCLNFIYVFNIKLHLPIFISWKAWLAQFLKHSCRQQEGCSCFSAYFQVSPAEHSQPNIGVGRTDGQKFLCKRICIGALALVKRLVLLCKHVVTALLTDVKKTVKCNNINLFSVSYSDLVF